jgi:hypothetical protein
MKSVLEFTLYRQSARITAAYEIYQDENSHNDLHFTDHNYYLYLKPIIITADT